MQCIHPRRHFRKQDGHVGFDRPPLTGDERAPSGIGTDSRA
jgi:hypothetical protein